MEKLERRRSGTTRPPTTGKCAAIYDFPRLGVNVPTVQETIFADPNPLPSSPRHICHENILQVQEFTTKS